MFPRPARLLFVLISLLSGPLAAPADDPRLQEQREAFQLALARAELGDWDAVSPYLELLRGYPLRPDLSAAWLRRSIGPETDAETSRFLEKYPDLSFSGDLRYQWARSLARRGRWDSFLAVYEANYADSGDTELRCLALQGRIATGNQAAVAEAGTQIWLSAFSLPEECDPVFEYLSERGLLTDKLTRRRIRLALNAGQVPLARYLARPLAEGDRKLVDRWAQMRADPAAVLSDRSAFGDARADRDLVVYGFRRLARQDPPNAESLWSRYQDLGLPPETSLTVERDIALAHARRFLPGARELVERQASQDADPLVAQWRVRLALRDLDWSGALAAVEGLPGDERNRTIWIYWRARSLDGADDTGSAEAIFSDLAAERDYYGFLAADRLGLSYQFGHRPTEPDEEQIASLAARPDVIRARELFMTGLFSRGRAEWRTLSDRLSPAQRAQASILAHRWGWHSQAIVTASGSGLIDDLDLRFPTPWRESFERLSRNATLEPSFTFGIARSESLFMSDVASRAGAVGLMQLMPATGKQTARIAGIRYRGLQTLTDPESNITLGTTYLGRMLDRFDGNPVLAAAAYNAGPHRVSSWLPEQRSLPADVWVDTMPFRETRRYVRRVLESDAVFDWRFDGEHRRLSQRMPPVRPPDD